ncbi:MAG: aspartate kinase [Candidatus Melainabacteria bacterium]|nr:aspartate kinase [Candidatus Melainabacteria bacterium]
MPILVQKFGGTSVRDAICIRRVAKIATDAQKNGYQVVVVVSAMGDTTDNLIDLARDITTKPDPREYDLLLSTGEQISIPLVAMAIHDLGVKAISQTGLQVGILTEDRHGKARITEIKTTKIKKYLNEGNIVVIAGFQGISETTGEITTLGRGGSDTTAVALAVALGAERCDIYTDVDAVYTTDPDIVKDASRLKIISYEEMLELASLGAQVLHPRSVEIAKNYNMPMRVRGSFKSQDEGTLVQGVATMEINNPVSGVALDESQARVAIIGVPDKPGIAAKVFESLAKKNISVDMIVQSTSQDGVNEIAFTVDKDMLDETKKAAQAIVKEINAKDMTCDVNIAKVSIVGAGMIGRPGIAAAMFKALADSSINIQMISTSEIKVSCVVDVKDGEKAVKAIHKVFELDKVNKEKEKV